MKSRPYLLLILIGILALFFALYTQNNTAVGEFEAQYEIGVDGQYSLYEEYIDVIGVDKVIDVITKETCHIEAHDLGRLIFKRTGNIEESLEICGDICTYGCMDGVILGMFDLDEEVISFDYLVSEGERVCMQQSESDLYGPGPCIHSLGHVIGTWTDNDFSQSMKICSMFSTDTAKHYCATGAFMQRDIKLGQEDAQKGLYPCNETSFPAACYRYKMAQILDYNFNIMDQVGSISDMCTKLSSPYKVACFYGIGHAYISKVVESPSLISEICVSGSDTDQKVCLEALVEGLVAVDPQKAQQACEVLTSDSQKQICEDSMERGLFNMEKDVNLYIN